MSNDALFTVDYEKCVRCGLCIEACPVKLLEMGDNGPEAVRLDICRLCGHCVAICPQAAIDHKKNPLAGQVAIDKNLAIDAKAANQFLRSRRSIRSYKGEAVSRDIMMQLLDVAHYAPSAGNTQGVSYIVVDDKGIIEKAAELTIEWMESAVKNETKFHWSFPYHIRMFREKGIDTILRKAPSLVLAVCESGNAKGRENTIFSLAYLELFAPSLGLGSCWAGLFEMAAFSGYGPLLELLKIPQNYLFTGAVMVGHPKYKFQRLVCRNPINVLWRGSAEQE